MWNFIKGAKWTFLIGALILAVAAGGVIYAVATGEGDEGFLAKWNKADLPATCTYNPDEIKGKRALLQDSWLATVSHSAVALPLISKCQPWLINKPFPERPPVGGVLVRVGTPPEKEEDGVTVTTPFDAEHGGSTILYHQADGSIGGAVIWIAPNIPENLELVVWVHEFGHALGLAHDRTRDSVMYPVAGDRAAKFTDKDWKHLREAYQ
jgi:hypothetical protein